jgi:uncharacterized protein YgfB (UPF0149 family)
LQLDFHILNDQLLATGAVCSVAELHGMLCGQVSGGRQCGADEWLKAVREFCDLEHFEITDDQRNICDLLVEASRSGLHSDSFEFAPLLPDDRCPQADRARELGAWCRGYLHGFGASGVTADTKIEANVAEVLRDFAKISQTVSELGDELDESEHDLVELIEYLRAGVMTVFIEMRGPQTPESDTLH